MKFQDFKSFREYDRQFVKVTNIDKRYIKSLKIEKLQEPIYGILYLDKVCGVTLRVLGDAKTEIKDKMLLLRRDCFEEIDFEVFEGTDFLNDILQNQISGYYDDKLNALLSAKELDEFRYEEFPLDVLAILPSEKQSEQMWVRLVMKTNQENVYIAELLDDSYFDKKYTNGKKVALVYYAKDDFKGLIINGLVKIVDE